jgi:hypothetical protein
MKLSLQSGIHRVAIAAIFALVSSCASTPSAPQATPSPSPVAATDVMGPPSPGAAASPSPSEQYGPFPGAPAGPVAVATPIPSGDQVVLVLGHGLARGFSHVGAIKALAEIKLPIHAIYATEVGALAAALHFTQPTANRVDWALLRFSEKNLARPEGGISILKLKSPERDLEEKLREVFGERRIEELDGRLHILLEDAQTGERFEARRGELWKAVRAALAAENGYSPIEVDGRKARSSRGGVAEAYRAARAAETYPIVVVLAGDRVEEELRREAGSGTEIVVAPVSGRDDLDLKKRNQAVFAGKSAVHQASARLLGLVGRSAE